MLNAGQTLYTNLGETFRPIVKNVLFLFDYPKNKVISYIRVITTKHTQIRDYIDKTYSSAQV